MTRVGAAIACAVLCIVAAACGSSGSSTSSTATTRLRPVTSTTKPVTGQVSGTWTRLAPKMKSAAGGTPEKGTVTIVYRGDVVGQSNAAVKVTTDASGVQQGASQNTLFTGTIRGIGSGTLRLAEAYRVSPSGAFVLNSLSITSSGTGAFKRSTVGLVLQGQVDAQGAGRGTYTGDFTK